MCCCFVFADVIDCVVVHFQETKQGSVKEALERGSRYLDTLGMGSSLGQKLKAAAKKKVESTTRVAKTKNLMKIETVLDAKRYLPQNVIGCSIQLLPDRRQWCAFYPGAVPGSRGRTWGAKFSKIQVLRSVLQWAWAEHDRATGEKCPHNLELLYS